MVFFCVFHATLVRRSFLIFVFLELSCKAVSVLIGLWMILSTTSGLSQAIDAVFDLHCDEYDSWSCLALEPSKFSQGPF
jgi:hypothetical protein